MKIQESAVDNLNVELEQPVSEDSDGRFESTHHSVSVMADAPSIQRVPLSRLKLSPLNVRKTGAEAGIEELAELIASEGVLQNLAVCPMPHKGKKKPPCFAVVAGGRRLRALQLLHREGRIPSDYLVPCLVVSGDQAVRVSTAENSGRQPMHPADEFEAFRQLVDAGLSLEEVAARFGIQPVVVQRRLKLANVAAEFIELYREEEITLEHLMAFALTDDHEQQRRVWASLPECHRTPHAIRAGLTETEVPSSDPRVKFVTIEAYEKAGGGVRKDLFSEEDSVYLQDTELLDCLVMVQLEERAKHLKDEGCTWVGVMPRLDYSDRARFVSVPTTTRAPTKDEQQALDQVREDLLSLDFEEEQLSEDDEERLTELDDRRDALQDKRGELEQQLEVPDPTYAVKSGALVYLNYAGEVCIDKGLLRPEDGGDLTGRRHRSKGSVNAGECHSAALLSSLTAHRTLAMRAVFSQSPEVALAAVVHRVTLATFYRGQSVGESLLQFNIPEVRLNSYSSDLVGTKAQTWMASQEEHLRGLLPKDPSELLQWVLQQSHVEQLALLAFCVSQTLNAVQCKEDASPADELASALHIDLRDWWTPTRAGYFSRISKDAIIQAVTEGASPEAGDRLKALKKGQAAEEAERLLAGTGWVPEFMRAQWTSKT